MSAGIRANARSVLSVRYILFKHEALYFNGSLPSLRVPGIFFIMKNSRRLFLPVSIQLSHQSIYRGALFLWLTVSAIGVMAAEPLWLDRGRLDTSAAEQQVAARELRRVAWAAEQRATATGTRPWLVQFNGVIREAWKKEMMEAGAILHGYMPENAFLIEATPETMTRISMMADVYWIGEYRPEYKRSRSVRAALTKGIPGTKDVNVIVFHPEDTARIAEAISKLPGCSVLLAGPMTDRGLVRAALTATALEEVTNWGEVEWVEPYLKPRLWNNIAVRDNKMGVTNVWSALGLTGAGQTIAVCDTGLDSGNVNTLHQDFTNRATLITLSGGGIIDTDGHGTHVAGSVLGSGFMSGGLYKGVAYEAHLVFQGAGANLNGIPLNLNDLFRQAYQNGARIHSDSWGYDDNGDYHTDSRNLDMYVWSNKTMLVLVAAGNSGTDANSNGIIDLGSVGSPATAKNCLSVGASENYRLSGGYSTYRYGIELWPSDYPSDPVRSDYPSRPDEPQGMVAFSSRGPCTDGRIKPDLVAPGSDIISTRSRRSSDTGWGTVSGNTNYIYMGGTSMATPLTAGAAGLVRQWLVEQAGIANPSAALIKGLMINGARDMAPGQYGTGSTQEIPYGRPNNVQGFGHVNLAGTLILQAGHFLHLHDTNSLTTGATNSFVIAVTATTTNKFIVTMTYSDYWAATGSGKKLVNDLDLTIRKPSGGILYANGRSSPDATNNVEQIEFTPDETGDYTVRVAGRTVPSGGSQAYALIIRGFDTGPADDLDILPGGGFVTAGPQGGPFAPSQIVYVLTNSGASSLNWAAAKGAGLTWLDLSKTNGTLNAGASDTVTLTVNASADSLSSGAHGGDVVFTNHTSGVAQTRAASLTARPASQFAWSTILSPQQNGTPFGVTLTAQDALGETVTAFSGTATLSGRVSATGEVGTASTTWNYPMSTYYEDARTQVIYLQSDLGGAATLDGLALNVSAVPGQTLGNWTIRIKHTAMNAHAPAAWEGPASGWTTVFQDDVTVFSTGWIWFPFNAPFGYNGVDNLLIDFSHNNSTWSTDGEVRYSTGAAGRSIYFRSDSNDGDPLNWSGTTPSPGSSDRYPNIRLMAQDTVSISPSVTASFTDGVWSGPITVNQIAMQMILRADSGAITGDSNLFDVEGPGCFTNAPGGLSASNIGAAEFLASWDALAGADTYRLDASASPAFAVEGAGAGGLEDFSSIGGGISSSYLTRTCTNNVVVWTGYKARIDQTVNGSEAICVRNEADSYFVSDTISGGVDEISIVCEQKFAGNGGTFDIFVSNMKVASAVPITTSVVTTKVSGIGVSGDFTIMVTNSGAVRPAFDNLSWTNPPSGVDAYLPGYSNRTVAGTSQVVTGLTADTTYYFRVRAVDAVDCMSGHSTTQSVTTTSGGHTITATAGLHGWIDPAGGVPVADGGQQAFTVTASNLYRIAAITTNAVSIDVLFGNASTVHVFTWTNVTADGAIHATFTEVLTTNSPEAVPQVWLEDNYPGTEDYEAAAMSDTDEDGLDAWEEYIAGTDPTDSASGLELERDPESSPDLHVIKWMGTSLSGRLYNVYWTTNLLSPLTPLFTDLPSAWPDPNVVTNEWPDDDSRIYYRIGVYFEE